MAQRAQDRGLVSGRAVVQRGADQQDPSWVEREWRIALRTGKPNFIDPVPLQTPDEAPPPPELASLHFNDWMLAFQRRRRSLQEIESGNTGSSQVDAASP